MRQVVEEAALWGRPLHNASWLHYGALRLLEGSTARSAGQRLELGRPLNELVAERASFPLGAANRLLPSKRGSSKTLSPRVAINRKRRKLPNARSARALPAWARRALPPGADRFRASARMCDARPTKAPRGEPPLELALVRCAIVAHEPTETRRGQRERSAPQS